MPPAEGADADSRMKHKLAAGATPRGKSELEFRRRAFMLRGCPPTLFESLSTSAIASVMAASRNQTWLSLEKISCYPIGFPISLPRARGRNNVAPISL